MVTFSALAFLLFLAGVMVGLMLMVFRTYRPRAKRIAKISGVGAVVSLIAVAVLAYRQDQNSAIAEGWSGHAERTAAIAEGVADPAEWRALLDERAATAAEEQAEAERIATEEARVEEARLAEERRVRQERELARQEALRPSIAQTRFMNAVGNARTDYLAASNDFQRGATRPERARAICDALQDTAVEEWVGTVTEVTTNSDGDGVVSIQLADNLTVKTWSNAFSDIGSDTLVPSGSSVYAELGQLETGDPVRFSGRFFRAETDCIEEQSVTMSGSMRDPAFTFRFSDVSPIRGID